MIFSNEEDEMTLQGMIEGWKAELEATFKGRIFIVTKPVFGERSENFQNKCQSKYEMVKGFLDQTTVKTNNKKDKITTEDLFEKYTQWYNNKGKYEYKDTMREWDIKSPQEFGKMMTQNFKEYESGRGQYRGKTKRYYNKIKYKTMELNTVKEFLDKYTEKTEDSKDRIAITKLVRMYNILDYKPRTGNDYFKDKAKLGEYRVKTSYENRVKGPSSVVEPCIMCVKATEELKEHFIKEGIEKKPITVEDLQGVQPPYRKMEQVGKKCEGHWVVNISYTIS